MNFAKWISFSTVIILVYIIWQIRKLILLVFTAVILASTLNFIVKKLELINIKRQYAILVSGISFVILILSFTTLVVPSLFLQFQQLFELVPVGLDKLIIRLDQIRDNISPEFSQFIFNLEEILPQIQAIFRELLTKGLGFISGFLGSLLSSLLLFALTLMFLADPIAYKKGFIRFFPSFYRPRVTTIIEIIKVDLEEWLINTFIKIVSIVILTYICLYIFQIPLVLAQSLLAGVLAFTPYIGVVVSVISPMAIAFITSGLKPWLILISYIVIHVIVDRVILAKLRPNKVKLIPANVIVGEVVYTNFLGLLGLLLVLPLTIIGQILVKEILIKDIFDQWQVRDN